MATIDIKPIINRKNNNIIYSIKVTKYNGDDNETPNMGNHIKFPDNTTNINFMPSEIPYKVKPFLTKENTVILELNMDQYLDIKYKLATHPEGTFRLNYIKIPNYRCDG